MESLEAAEGSRARPVPPLRVQMRRQGPIPGPSTAPGGEPCRGRGQSQKAPLADLSLQGARKGLGFDRAPLEEPHLRHEQPCIEVEDGESELPSFTRGLLERGTRGPWLAEENPGARNAKLAQEARSGVIELRLLSAVTISSPATGLPEEATAQAYRREMSACSENA